MRSYPELPATGVQALLCKSFCLLRPSTLIPAKRRFKLSQQALVFGSILFKELLLRYPLR